jgi:outer membrane receptor for ferrienterochelin and colicins
LYFLFFLPVIGQADESSGELEMPALMAKGLEELVEIDVSLATGTPKPLNLAPSVATVITARDIEDMGATTVDEVLETVPGIHVQPSSTNIFSSIWVIRGIISQLNPQVLLLIDGQPLRQNVNGDKPNNLRMPVSMIARIEIIRGPGSAMLGADAFSGAINIITKDRADISGTKVGVRIGSFDSYDLWAQHGGSYNGWDIAFGAEYTKGDGDSGRIIDADFQTSLDALSGTNYSLAPGPLDTHYETFNSTLSVHKEKFALTLNNIWAIDNGLGAGAANILNGGRSHANYFVLLGSLSYAEENLFPDFGLTTTLSGSYLNGENTFYFYPPSVPTQAIGKPGANELNGGIDLTGDYRGFRNHRIRLSVGMNNYNTDTFQHKNYGPGVPVQFGPLVDISDTPYVYLTDQHRRLLYAAVQEEWTFARGWELTAGVRYDDYSDVGSEVSPRLALVWQTTDALTTKLLYGHAFRPPTFGELYITNNPVTQGNPNLDPETIDTYEIAFDYRPTKAIHLALNLFEYRISGFIDYVPNASGTASIAQNARDQKGHGFEIEAEWLVTDTLRLRGNVAYQQSKDKKTGEIVPDAPGLEFYGNAHWKFLPDWSLDGQYFWVGDRHRAEGDPRPKIKDYDLVNLTLRRKNILKHWEFAVAVRNLFDEDAREPSQYSEPIIPIPNDYPLEGRSFWAELRYTF